jgi:probable HAF family extracellular repeat protein
MRTNFFKLIIFVGVLSFFGIISLVSTSGATNYIVTDLGPGVARDINNLGQVVGSYFPSPLGFQKGFFWDSIGGRENLDFGQNSGFESINDSGEAVCWGWPLSAKGLLWNSTTGVTIDIPIWPQAINNARQVAGVSENFFSAIWDSGNGVQVFGDGRNDQPWDINDYGQVVGAMATSTGIVHGFIWDDLNGLQDIGTLGGYSVVAHSINNIGQVVGASRTQDTTEHAFIWDSAHGMLDLGTLYGQNSEALGINNLGVVVGRSIESTPGSGYSGWRAFLWDAQRRMKDLNDLIPANSGWILGTAFAINNHGQIVGYGRLGGVEEHRAFLLTPVPSTIEVDIDIRPWSKRNPINYKGHGILPVAILSTPDFDAPSKVDQNSLTFGATGNEKSLAFCNRRPKDVSRDGSKDDLVCHFYIEVAGFKCGDTEGILNGKTVSGIAIEGEDLVRIVHCK